MRVTSTSRLLALTVAMAMGFVVAGDFLLAIKGALSWNKVRERCGKCVEKENAAK